MVLAIFREAASRGPSALADIFVLPRSLTTADMRALQSWYHVHHVTREEFQKKVEEQRKFDFMESSGRLDAGQLAKTTFSQCANELSTGKRALQAAAAIRIETDTEQSLAKVFGSF